MGGFGVEISTPRLLRSNVVTWVMTECQVRDPSRGDNDTVDIVSTLDGSTKA